MDTPATPHAAPWRPPLPPLLPWPATPAGRSPEGVGPRRWAGRTHGPQVACDLGRVWSFLIVPALCLPVTPAESAVEEGPTRDRKAVPLPWAVYRLHASLLPPGPGPSGSRDCPPAVLGPLRALTEMPMLEPQPVLRNRFLRNPNFCRPPESTLWLRQGVETLYPHFVIQGPANTDWSAEAVSRHRGRGLSPRTQAGPQLSNADRATKATACIPFTH